MLQAQSQRQRFDEDKPSKDWASRSLTASCALRSGRGNAKVYAIRAYLVFKEVVPAKATATSSKTIASLGFAT